MWVRKQHQIKSNIEQCLNCGHPFSKDDQFCSQCGQIRTDGRITFGQLLKDAFQDILNVDSRVFLSLKELWYPGRLSRKFFQGKHQAYYPPARFFFISMVIQFTLLGFVLNGNVDFSSDQIFDTHRMEQAKGQLALLDSLEQVWGPNILVDRQSDLDSLKHRLSEIVNDSITFTLYDIGAVGKSKSVRIAFEDMEEINSETLRDKYNLNNRIQNLFALQTIRSLTHPLQVFRFFLGNLIWMVLAMVPCLAFFMKLIYFRHRLLFVEHVIFLFHVHVFTFILLTIYHVIGLFYSAIYETIYIPLVIAMIYTYLSMKVYYQQTYLKTTIKFILTGFIYLFLMAIFLGITSLLSLLLFN